MTMVSMSIFTTGVGVGGVVAGPQGVVEVFLPFGCSSMAEAERRLLAAWPEAGREGELAVAAAHALERYFKGEKVTFDLPLDLVTVTPFTRRVYEATLAIGYGEVSTYAEIARGAGAAGGARAAGGALGKNRLPVIIPCHRVVAGDGRLTGYTAPGGIEAKRWLLNLEGVGFDINGRVLRGENTPVFPGFAQS